MSTTVDMQSIYYTSTDGGDSVVTFSQLVISGDQWVELIMVTKEILPLLPTEYTFDAGSGTITLLNNLVLDVNETLFVLFKIVQPSVTFTQLTTQTGTGVIHTRDQMLQTLSQLQP